MKKTIESEEMEVLKKSRLLRSLLEMGLLKKSDWASKDKEGKNGKLDRENEGEE